MLPFYALSCLALLEVGTKDQGSDINWKSGSKRGSLDGLQFFMSIGEGSTVLFWGRGTQGFRRQRLTEISLLSGWVALPPSHHLTLLTGPLVGSSHYIH